MPMQERIRDNRSRPRAIEFDGANCPNFKGNLNYIIIWRYLSRKKCALETFSFRFPFGIGRSRTTDRLSLGLGAEATDRLSSGSGDPELQTG